MWISEFAQAAGLSVDTVRFYVRQGLLAPKAGAQGGSRAYQVFSAADLRDAATIRVAQVVGLSLAEIAALLTAQRAGRGSRATRVQVMRQQRDALAAKASELLGLVAFLDAKIGWLEAGAAGPHPLLGAFVPAMPSAGGGPRRRRKAAG